MAFPPTPQKQMKRTSHFKKSNQQYLLSKFKFSMTEFWKTCICHCEFDNFPIAKDVSDEISDVNEAFDIV